MISILHIITTVKRMEYNERACCASDNSLPGTCPVLQEEPTPIDDDDDPRYNLGVILGGTALGVAVVAVCAYIFLHKSKTCGGSDGSSGRSLPKATYIEEPDIFVRRPVIDDAQPPEEPAPQAPAAVGSVNIGVCNGNTNGGVSEGGALGQSTSDSEAASIVKAFDDLEEELEARLNSLRRY